MGGRADSILANVAGGPARAGRSSAGAARGPGRVARSRRRAGDGGVPWLGIGVLIMIGIAVFAARTVKLPRSAQPSLAEPTSVALVATTRPVSPTVRPTPLPAAAQPTAERGRPTPAPIRGAPTAPPASHALPTTTPAHAASTATAAAAAAVTPGATGVTPAATAPTPAGVEATSTAATEPGARGASGLVALTFDAGADRGYAEDILDILQEQHVVASFGITGLWAKSNPDLVRRMAADGHLVFNHTLDHRSFTGVSDKLGGLSAARRRAELDDADSIIAPLIGHTTKPFYRLPYGDDDAQVAADLAPDGYSHKIGWTVDSLGWRGSRSADIVSRCLKLGAPGAVYVFHVGRASQDAIALPQIIAGLRDKALAFRRIDQA